MTNIRTTIQEEMNYKVMRLLEDNLDLIQRVLVRSLWASVGCVNYCLKALLDIGWVKVKNFAYSKNKLGCIYVLTPNELANKTLIIQRFFQRKMDEYEQLKLKSKSLNLKFKTIMKKYQKYD